MKKIALSFSLILLTLFSFAEGGCIINAQHIIETTTEGKSAKLFFTVSGNGTDCSFCDPSLGGKWFKYNGTSFEEIIPSSNGDYVVSEPGVYRIEACGLFGVTTVKEGTVYKNDSPIDEPDIKKFSIYPNPLRGHKINLLIPTNPISEAKTFRLELYNTIGNRIYENKDLEFGIHHVSIDMRGKGAGIYILKIKTGEETKVLKFMMR